MNAVMGALIRAPADGGFVEALPQVSALEKTLSQLHAAGHLREVVLARLCFGGMRLKEAVEVSAASILAARNEDDLAQKLNRYVVSDFYFDTLPGVAMICKDYCMALKTKSVWGKRGASEAQPIFPSRKKGVPVTPRSMERCLATAMQSSGVTERMSYRLIQRTGA